MPVQDLEINQTWSAGQKWTGATARRVTKALPAQGLAAPSIFGDGVRSGFEATDAGSGVVEIAPGIGVATHSSNGTFAVETVAPVAVDCTALLGSPVFIHATVENSGGNDTRETRLPLLVPSLSDVHPDGILIAEIALSAGEVDTITDRRVLIEFGTPIDESTLLHTTGNETKSAGTLAFAVSPIVPTVPSSPTGAVNQEYVKTLIRNLDPQNSVLDKDLSTPPGSPATGDRYIVAASPTGAWSGHANDIAEWDGDGATWIFTIPNEGALLRVEDENLYYDFNGAAWEIYKFPILMADLPDSGVTPQTIGSGTQIPQLTINAKGVITVATPVTVTIPDGAANSSAVVQVNSFSNFQWLKHNGTAYALAQADTAANAATLGIATGVSGAGFTLVTDGKVTGLSGLTPGLYYLNPAVAGGMTATEPAWASGADDGKVHQVVFIATSATEGYVIRDPGYVLSKPSVTGGGQLITGGFDLTVPKTGTAVTGSGAAGQISYFSGDANTVASDGDVTWNSSTKRFAINASGAAFSPSANFHIVGLTPASVGTTPATASTAAVRLIGGVGGDTSIATTGAGGAGGALVFTTGAGGQAASATTASTGGAGGSLTSTGGVGGAATVAGAGSNTGGAGGACSLSGGVGGAATGGTSGSNTGGAGGSASIFGGVGGTATTGSGTLAGGTGGAALLQGGVGGVGTTGGTGGAATCRGGAGAAAAGAAGGASGMVGGAGSVTGTGGAGGACTIAAGNAGGTSSNLGGACNLTAGNSAGDTAGGTITVICGTGGTGTGTAGAAGGALSLSGGVGGVGSATGGNGGAATFQGGAAAAKDGAAGGACTVQGRAGSSTGSGGAGGALSLTGGAAGGDDTVNRTGGAISIAAGASKGTTQAGGAISLTAGRGATTGVGGAVNIIAGLGGTTSGAGGAITFQTASTTSIATRLTISATGLFTFGEASDLAFGTTTGTKIGTGATQKLGFWNTTPVVQPSGWTGATDAPAPRKSFDSTTVTLSQLAEVVATMIAADKTIGVKGA